MENPLQQREAVKDKVSGRQGYIHGTWSQEGCETKFQFLHVDGDGNRALPWVPASQLERLEPGDLPPFPNPYATVVGGDTPPGGPG